MTSKDRLLELAKRLEAAHGEWMNIVSKARAANEPHCIEAFRKREAAEEDFQFAIREAMTSVH